MFSHLKLSCCNSTMKFILYWFNGFFLFLFSPVTFPFLLSSSPPPRSCRDQSDYLEFSGSVSAEDEYLPVRRRSTKLAMTRLDPPSHRPNPRAWMDEARSRDAFSSRSGTCKLTSYIVTFVNCFIHSFAGWDALERAGKDAWLNRSMVGRRKSLTILLDLFFFWTHLGLRMSSVHQ